MTRRPPAFVSRRMALKAVGLAGSAAAAGGLAAPAIAQTAKVQWRMATSWPKSLDTIYGSAAALCERVGQLTDGQFQITPFAGGEIVPALQVFDAVSNGTVQCCHTLSSYFVGKNSAYVFDAGLPFGLNTRQHQAWMTVGGGLELTREVFRPANIMNFAVGNVGVQMGGWFRKEVTTPDDLKGLRFRIGGFGGQILSRLGAVPQQIPASDIYPALERGTIDATEWIGPHDDEKLGLAKVAKFYYTPGWWEGSAQITSFVNTQAWDALPAPFKAAFETAANEQVLLMMANYDVKNPQAMRKLLAQGAQLKVFSQAILDACFKASLETMDDHASKNPDFKKLFDNWKAFSNLSNSWLRASDSLLDAYRLNAPAWPT
jgi:TRAP-type mannitol/chloroaromatic compound transport system substrate-binding protein